MKYRTDSYEKLQMKEKNGKVSSKLVVSTIYNMNYWGKGIYLKHYFFFKRMHQNNHGELRLVKLY